MRSIVFFAALCLSSPVFGDELVSPTIGALTIEDIQNARQRLVDLGNPATIILDASCCKMCSAGKACGDSCINRSYQCTKGPGCACDE